MTDRPGTTVMDSVLGDDAGTVSIRYSPTSAHLVLAGEVDARLNAQLASATLQLTEYGLPVDVDTRDVTFMDSAVIALIAHLANRLTAPVRIVAPSDQVRFLLEVTHVGDLVEVVEPAEPIDDPAPPSEEPLAAL